MGPTVDLQISCSLISTAYYFICFAIVFNVYITKLSFLRLAELMSGFAAGSSLRGPEGQGGQGV